MLIRVDDIKEAGLNREYAAAAAEFPELSVLEQRGEVFFPEPITTKLRAIRVGEMIQLDGTVSTSVRFVCSRCLKVYPHVLELVFTLTYARNLPAIDDAETGEELELNAEDLGLELLSGDELDLHAVIQEQVLLGLPLQPLCEDTCRGLCPRCGVDLNTATCNCAGDGFAGKFSVLKDWSNRQK
ncbi:MAG: hypothetical protein A2091_02475 [Desulfuromonadales bacterium GWD2_61_12]|nr:MAG: hypothetical protein A2005_13085 [Desulfuromonadales bacterium GWC2_61_20]OGR35376.1 MAG: hypothetical protein A2091_02475 [Desulfuromonadales bacterium GWD2_61_12]HAD05424.1 DUF177 domain-containing protein [Desulfuromonas sp.]HBT83930.1 DUF177 domain-containing protein [Desulfuromonas sp.]